jgi:glycosyltransferase involved in cell wall biosynthesis
MKLSFVIPVFNEEESLSILCNEIKGHIPNEYTYEILFIDDGSTDNSFKVLKELAEKDANIKLIKLRKNFGKSAALNLGFRQSTGEIVFTMDADLQDDPADILRMLEKLEEGYDLVSGWKKNRKDGIEKRLPSKLFNKVTSILSGIKLRDFNCGYKAYRREVIDSIDIYGEMHRYIPVLAYRKGFRITEIPIEHHKREFGKSKYGFERYLRGLFDSLTSTFLTRFYDRPMHFFGRVGLLLFTIGFIICSVLTYRWFMYGAFNVRPLLMLGILLIILGVQSVSTGFLGELIVDATYRSRYNERHVKEVIDINMDK